jgi:E1A/CREB-binding protein
MAQGQNRTVLQSGQMHNSVVASASSVSSQPNMVNGISQDTLLLRQEMLNRT